MIMLPRKTEILTQYLRIVNVILTQSGIVLPETVKEKPQEGKVLAVGPGARDDDGKRQPPDVKVGDRVLFARYAGTEIKQNGTKYLIMRESDILTKVE